MTKWISCAKYLRWQITYFSTIYLGNAIPDATIFHCTFYKRLRTLIDFTTLNTYISSIHVILCTDKALISYRLGHSVQSPSMVDPQWNIWYWGSKWNLHPVCWDAVGCEWGTTSVYFGITYVSFIPSRLPVFAVEPQYRHQDFLFLSKASFEGHLQNVQNI